MRRAGIRRLPWIHIVAMALGGAIALSPHRLNAADEPAPAAIVLQVPYPVSGPQDIQASDRASRSYRAIAARSMPPITDTMAAMVEAALWTGADLRVSRSRRTSPRALASHDPEPADAKHDLPDLILAGDDILRTSLSAAANNTGRWAPSVIETIAEMPYVLVCTTAQCRGLAAKPPGDRQLRSLHLRSIGTAGELGGSAIAGREWLALTKTKPLLVPYAGGNGIVGDLVAERIEAAFLALPLALRHLGHAKLHAVGITSTRRFEALPQLPTLTEAGMPLVFESWFAVFAAAHLPAALTRRVQTALRAYRTEEATRSELHRIGLVPSSATPAQMSRRIETEQVRLQSAAR